MKALSALTLVVMVGGVTLELAFVAAHSGEIPAYRVVSFLYLVLPSMAFSIVAAAVGRSRPENPVGLLFALLGVVVASGVLSNGYTVWELPGSEWIVWGEMLLGSGGYGLLALALLLFPTGRAFSTRWRWLGRLTGTLLGAVLLTTALAPWRSAPYPNDRYTAGNPIGLQGQPWMAEASEMLAGVGGLLILVALVSLVARWRKSEGDERQQVKWMGLGGLVFGIEAWVGIIWVMLGEPTAGSPASFLIGDGVFIFTLTIVPVAMGLAIVRHRLYDVDQLISRTIVYGSLAVLIGLAYVGVVVLVGDAVTGTWGSATMAGLIVTTAAAMGFHHLRSRIQSRVDRWVFGVRAAPYEVMAELSRRLAETIAPSDFLDRIAKTAGQATRARSARASVMLADGSIVGAAWGDSRIGTFDQVVQVVDGDTPIGEISVAGGTGHPDNVEHLKLIAGVSTVAMRNLRLYSELQALLDAVQKQNSDIAASRARLINASRDERRHLQVLIAEQIEPHLAFLKQGLPHLRRMALARDAGLADRSGELVHRATDLVEAIRALSRGVLPSVLADHGLIAALRSTLRRAEIDVSLDSPTVPPTLRLPPDFEVSVFLLLRAVLDNASASGAGGVAIRLERAEGEFRFSITRKGDAGLQVWGREVSAASDRIVALGGEVDLMTAARGLALTGSVPTTLQETSLRKVSTA